LGFLTPPAFAATSATVQTINGTLSLNRGDGYVEVISWADAVSGNQVMANPGSSGKIIYADGCTIEVKPGEVYTVADSSPCSSGVVRRPVNYVIGGLVIAGGTVAIIALTNNGDSDNNNKKSKRNGDQSASP
jgi:hypothetical protein